MARRHGSIAAALQARGHAVTLFKGDALAVALAVEDYDAVVVAASIVVGRYQAYIRDFVKRHAATLNDRPTAFASVSGGAPETDAAWRAEAEQHVRDLLAETGWRPRWTAAFAGALRFRRYDPITRFIMKLISRSQGGPTDTSGDYEFTDWHAVDRYAASLAEDLSGAGGTGE